MDFDAKKRNLPGFFLNPFVRQRSLLLRQCVGLLIVVSGLSAVTSADSGAIRMHPRPHAGAFVRVKTLVEIGGSLQVGPESNAQTMPLTVSGEMFFDERGLEGTDAPSLRRYWKAKADLKVGEQEHQRTLRPDREMILLQGSRPQLRFVSAHGPLTREELDLLDVAGSGTPPECLLPEKAVKPGDEWGHTDEVVQGLLRLEEVKSNTLTSKWASRTQEHVKVELKGKVIGVVHGVSSTIEVVGSYRYHTKDQLVDWLSLSLKEKREVSVATPGYEVVSRIRTARNRINSSAALTNKVVSELNVAPAPGERLLEFVAADNLYRMALDRRWFLLTQRDANTVLRFVDGGELIASCKVGRLNRMAAGTEMTLFGFQKDVQRALDKHCEQIVTSSESVNPQGVRVLRVEAAGKSDETPVRWVYYHLSDENGQRLSTIFTYEASRVDEFAGVDESLTSSVQFLAQPAIQARVDGPQVK